MAGDGRVRAVMQVAVRAMAAAAGAMRRPWLMAGLAFGGLAGTLVLALAAVCLTSGCSSVGYYAQAVNGHLDLLQRARPVPEVLADPATPPALRERLALTQQMRDFAVRELGLPDNGSYRRYADLNRPAAVWNVVAAPELSLTLKTWCFPVVGCVGYRGYYRRDSAEALAAELRAHGLEVQVYGVPAYSTLGKAEWLGGDPLLNTFVGGSEAEVARLVFHELAHQVAYAPDDTTFNESYATAVERIGGRLWLQHRGAAADRAGLEALRVQEQRQAAFRAFAAQWRERLDAVYRSGADAATQRARKAEVMAAMRADHERLKREAWGGFAGYDGWVARANNASFGVMAAYNELVPQFESLFVQQGRDFARFHAEVRRLAALPKAERRATLAALPPPAAE